MTQLVLVLSHLLEFPAMEETVVSRKGEGRESRG